MAFLLSGWMHEERSMQAVMIKIYDTHMNYILSNSWVSFHVFFAMFNTELAASWFWERQSFLSSKFDWGFYIASVYCEFVFNVDTDESGGFFFWQKLPLSYSLLFVFFPLHFNFFEEEKTWSWDSNLVPSSLRDFNKSKFCRLKALSNLVKVDTSRPASQKFGSAILNIFRHFILLLRVKIKS